jgi:hypothetical protein
MEEPLMYRWHLVWWIGWMWISIAGIFLAVAKKKTPSG